MVSSFYTRIGHGSFFFVALHITIRHSIKYIDNKFGVNHYIQLSERFNKSIEDWRILKSVLYKSYLNGDIDSHRNKFAAIIYENAILEEDIANRILELD